MTKKICIAGSFIGEGEKPYIVAELSANHNGSLDTALKTVEMAKNAGADAIKLQTYTADTMTIDCDNDDFQISGGLWDGYNLYQLYRWAQTPFDWHQALFEHAKEVGITCFSTPFDESAVELLESLEAPAYKIASFELTDLPLIARVAKTRKPIIMSTGMANLSEIKDAVECARDNECNELVLLHCISAYPAPVDQANLATIGDLKQKFNCVVGLSDHTLGTAVAVSSVALGAAFIEKHVTLSRREKGPDAEFSIEPDELARLCAETNDAWRAIGTANYELKQDEQANIKFRRSLYFVQDIQAGEIITRDHVRRIRPGFGLPPKEWSNIVGRRVKTSVLRGTPVSWEVLDG